MCELDENGHGGGNGEARVTLPLEALVDELVLTYDRRDGTLTVGGRVVNAETALTICQRAVTYWETQVRLAAAMHVKQQQSEQARVAAILDRTRGGRG